ncbi:MAG TPA: hypothetical protein VNZ26_30050, partial [Vicinamibacterales bacterium]|nr:hypothetical protein [Vicinamibacterales bacterium]
MHVIGFTELVEAVFIFRASDSILGFGPALNHPRWKGGHDTRSSSQAAPLRSTCRLPLVVADHEASAAIE